MASASGPLGTYLSEVKAQYLAAVKAGPSESIKWTIAMGNEAGGEMWCSHNSRSLLIFEQIWTLSHAPLHMRDIVYQIRLFPSFSLVVTSLG